MFHCWAKRVRGIHLRGDFFSIFPQIILVEDLESDGFQSFYWPQLHDIQRAQQTVVYASPAHSPVSYIHKSNANHLLAIVEFIQSSFVWT